MKSKEYNLTNLKAAIKEYSEKYDSLFHNKTAGSPTKEQSINNPTKTRRSKPIGSYTEKEWEQSNQGQFRVY